MFAGLAGGLHALNYEIVAAEAVGAGRSGTVLLMAYIGGVHHFFGAVLGAITITWLQVSLSDYTTAWQLYLGLFFMAVVLFAPGGLSGLLLMHRPILRTRAFPGLLKAYAIAAAPALVAAVGAIMLLEINYRRATQPDAGAQMRLFWIDMDTATPWPWLAALALLVAGAFFFRRSWPLVARAWQAATDEARAAGRRPMNETGDDRRCALQLRDLHKRFGATPIIRGVSLDIRDGERHAIIGPNGAGKSTLFNLISGRFAPTTGSIRLHGEDDRRPCAVRDQPPRTRAQLPGHQHLPAHVGVREHPLQRPLVARLPLFASGTTSPSSPTPTRAPTRSWSRSA